MKNSKTSKEWRTPSMEEVNLADTEYGGTTVTQFDNIYQDAAGNWGGTFVPETPENSHS